MPKYHAAYYLMDNGWHMAEVMDFPGVISQGRTLRSARRMIRSALRLMIEYYVDERKPLPDPNPKAKPSEGKPLFQETIPVRVNVKIEGVR